MEGVGGLGGAVRQRMTLRNWTHWVRRRRRSAIPVGAAGVAASAKATRSISGGVTFFSATICMPIPFGYPAWKTRWRFDNLRERPFQQKPFVYPARNLVHSFFAQSSQSFLNGRFMFSMASMMLPVHQLLVLMPTQRPPSGLAAAAQSHSAHGSRRGPVKPGNRRAGMWPRTVARVSRPVSFSRCSFASSSTPHKPGDGHDSVFFPFAIPV